MGSMSFIAGLALGAFVMLGMLIFVAVKFGNNM